MHAATPHRAGGRLPYRCTYLLMLSRRQTSEALAQLSRRKPTQIDLLNVIAEIDGESDRAVALIRSALVEAALERALLNRMRPLNSADRRRLFGLDAPLSSFAGKTAIAYAIRLIGSSTRDDLDCVREIRNAFAHTIIYIDFSTKEVADHCGHLQLPGRFPPGWGPHDLPWPPPATEPRRLFLATANLLWLYLTDAASDTKTLPDEA